MDFDLPEPTTRRNQGTQDPPEHPFVLPPIPDIIIEEYDLASSPIHFVSQEEDTSPISDSIHKTLTEQLEVLSVANSTWAARILLSCKDVSAKRVADGLAVTRCQQVTANYTFLNHEVNGTCYTMMPVFVGDQLWFLLPCTTDLIESSPTTPCPYPIRTNTIPTQRVLPPNMRINTAAKTFLFNPPGTFFSTIDSYEMAPAPYTARLQQNQQKISNRLSKWGILENTWLAVRNTTLKACQSLSNLYANTNSKLTEGVESFIRSIPRMVFWMLVPTLVDVILIGCCIIYLKLYHTSRNNRVVNAVRTPSPNGIELDSPLFVPGIYAVRNSTNSSLPYIELIIGKSSVTALIDSGASISYMRLSTLHEVASLLLSSSPMPAASDLFIIHFS
ncbi:unnamed protein product [Heligmosomoides polygyrus]|uniref:Peptidase A1 domain-containing protein n=1 Tax=Heligmosomoides polygyrus TaxID=6339 RepID=A0A183G519_HELPZ|nr:unnamed protein product [Heligmosomoides polygyrus]